MNKPAKYLKIQGVYFGMDEKNRLVGYISLVHTRLNDQEDSFKAFNHRARVFGR